MNHRHLSLRGAAWHVQRGVSLLFALLSLAAISLAAVALVRSVDSGTLVIGNLGFKQDATAAADRATEAARAWLMTPGRDLTVDSAGGVGYYATSQDGLDPTGRLTSATNRMAVVDWGDPDSCSCYPTTCSSCSRLPSNEISLNGGAVRARYLITRLCPVTGAVVATNACAQPAAVAISSEKARGELRVGTESRPSEVAQAPYYRVIVRTVSGRNTVSFTETVLY
ncbi:MAG: pilus assembly protein PilX [Aquincola sp.]|nr:pilus assembly protein PilX [Aquincola sp.]MDH5330806.1 pilus assembly protein PilX [Aquincola sp.]